MGFLSGAVIGNSSVPHSVALWAVSYMDGDMGPLLTLPLGLSEVTREFLRRDGKLKASGYLVRIGTLKPKTSTENTS